MEPTFYQQTLFSMPFLCVYQTYDVRELWGDSFFLIGGFLLRECYGLLGDAFVCVALDWPLLLALEDGL